LPKLSTTRSGGMLKRARPKPLLSSHDPSTSVAGVNARPRGLVSLITGRGPTSSLIFGLAADTRIHTYDMGSLSPVQTDGQSMMQSNTFYTGLAISPCGRFLACGSPQGRASVFDVSTAGGACSHFASKKVELYGQTGEVGALDWADNMLATCADDGTVRIWRSDAERQRQCEKDPEEGKWSWSWAHTS
jgi:denticleless